MRTSGTANAESGASHRFTGVLVGVLLLTIAFAGCMGEDPAPGDGDGEEMTADDGLEVAEQEAMDWSSDATLFSISSIETHGDPPEEWPTDAFEFQQDDTLGDGYAPIWAYTYQDDEQNEVTIFVNTEGETYQGSGDSGFSQNPLESWELDSPEAVEIAKEDGNFSSILEADDAEIGYFLGGEEDGAGWLLNAQSDSMGEEATVLVDADTGERETFPTG